ncbi:MAG: ESX secretion-associated protein EspG [Mycobacterium sp.]|nr:ESX secretion-associated protein EspG [Mycobacterium sp.]
MLTTTLDGLWVLQVLSGIEVLAPELGLRPHLPSVETTHMALAHPVAEELRDVGAIGPAGEVDQTVLEWMTVLARREVGLLLHAQTPSTGPGFERVLLARFAQWWVSLERCGVLIRLGGVGTAATERSAGLLIQSQIQRLCGDKAPADVRPVTLDGTELLAAVRDRTSLRSFLRDCGFDGDQIGSLMLAADGERSVQVSLVALQSGVAGHPGDSGIGSTTVTVIDTPQGRLLSEHDQRAGRTWMIVGPGSTSGIASAVQRMLRRLPARDDWHCYRKVV